MKMPKKIRNPKPKAPKNPYSKSEQVNEKTSLFKIPIKVI